MTTPVTAAKTIKALSRVALINLPDDVITVLNECFKQYKIHTIPVTGVATSRLWREKYEGCVVRLDENCEAVLKSARSSPSNKSMLIYGLTPDIRNAMKFSSYGVNSLFYEPLDKPAVLRVVRATNLLVLHEYRRYVRIPVAIEVELEIDGIRYTTITVEVSSGGMSLHTEKMFWETRAVRSHFQLPGMKKTTVDAQICWRKEDEKTVGIRFNQDEPGKMVVRDWIDAFLEFV